MIFLIVRVFFLALWIFFSEEIIADSDICYMSLSGSALIGEKDFRINYEYFDDAFDASYVTSSYTDFDSGFGASFALGKTLSSSFTIEAEANFYDTKSKILKYSQENYSEKEYISSYLIGLFINIYYSLDLLGFYPYVSSGAGFVGVSYEGALTLTSKDDGQLADFRFDGANAKQMGYKFKLGLNYPLGSEAILGIGYEYVFSNRINEFDNFFATIELDGDIKKVERSKGMMGGIENGIHCINLSFRVLSNN